MDIRRLESFCRVFELRSFSKAADDLFLSQPTVSSHIASLEDELSCRLFDRIGRQILPTQAGIILYSYASRIIEHIGRAVSDIHLLNNRVVGRLVLGGSTIPSHYLLPQVLKRYREAYPEVEITVHTADSCAIEERLLEGEVDVGVIGASAAFPELEYRPVLQDELLLLSSRHLCPEGATADPETLCRLPWIIREKGSGTRKAMEKGLEQLGIRIGDLRIVLTAHTTEAVMQAIINGMGVSITSRLAASEAMARHEVLDIRAPELDLRRVFYTVTHRQRAPYPASSRFVDMLQALSGTLFHSSGFSVGAASDQEPLTNT